MKKVIFNKEVDTINTSELDDSWLVGVKFESGTKAQLVLIEECIWVWVAIRNNKYHGKTKYTSLNNALNSCFGNVIYATKDVSEFKKWLLAE